MNELQCAPRDGAPPGPAAGEAEQMSEYGIAWDGVHFYFSGYRYQRLGDAVNYARLVRERPALRSFGTAPAPQVSAVVTTEADRERMARLDIVLEQGVYRYGGYRYDRLADAVAYAELVGRAGHRPAASSTDPTAEAGAGPTSGPT